MTRYGIIVLAAALLLAACGAQPVPLTGADRDAVLAYSEPKADSLLRAFNTGDYAVFSRDFTDNMLKGIPEAGFNDTRTKVTGKIGQYVSREVSSVLKFDAYVTVVYTAKFEQEENVTIRISFDSAEPHRISGLWFDSQKLRQ